VSEEPENIRTAVHVRGWAHEDEVRERASSEANKDEPIVGPVRGPDSFAVALLEVAVRSIGER
jgi:hypothetical protein